MAFCKVGNIKKQAFSPASLTLAGPGPVLIVNEVFQICVGVLCFSHHGFSFHSTHNSIWQEHEKKCLVLVDT